MLQDRLPQVPSGTKLAEGSPHQLLDLAFSRSLQGPSWLKLLQDPPTRLLELHRVLALSLPKCRPAPPGAWALQDPRGPLGGASPKEFRQELSPKGTRDRASALTGRHREALKTHILHESITLPSAGALNDFNRDPR